MNRTILLSVFGAAFAIAPLHAQPQTRKARPIEPPTQAASPATRRLHEFQDDDISLVLRTLARSARLNIVVSDQVTGTVSMRIEDKTPREAIEIIAEAKELILDEKKGIIYVRPKNPPPPGTTKAPDLDKTLEEGLAEKFAPALIKFYDSLLDYQSRPETAQKIAKAKKALYDALIAEGFTKDEAFRLILTNQELSIPNANK